MIKTYFFLNEPLKTLEGNNKGYLDNGQCYLLITHFVGPQNISTEHPCREV